MKRESYKKTKGYTGTIISKKSSPQMRIMLGIPMTGLLRSEWVLARYGQVIPCNWGVIEVTQFLDQFSPLNFLVAAARNIIAQKAVLEGYEWLWFIDHDVILPPACTLMWNQRIHDGDIPIFGGLYFAKGVPAEPLTYRGRGNSYYDKWKIGDKVWVDGLGMGNTVIHCSILKALYEEGEEYEVAEGLKVRRIFETPANIFYDPEKLTWGALTGTEDLTFCTKIMENDIFKKAGWPKYQRKKYPFLVDTSVFCRHIDFNGVQYPSKGEELQFIKGK